MDTSIATAGTGTEASSYIEASDLTVDEMVKRINREQHRVDWRSIGLVVLYLTTCTVIGALG